ncbi:Uncharacterised protein [Listeria grayi]|uniref:Uncharacterized protein n=3 Tax=Listeria grayi TaxID=1641 RepID=D7V0C3_LISGR|nr:hypothetical protein [Listeria grayi]EFI83016.1 hypothetical protein HMPREF0556_11701 [Listeria grayi DSM 20601]EUJ29009.1 hypothetical protein LMUR_05230 [Listeria grayi FSL F6-1183]MBC1921283.1 hypothetical protein [Listeria grayi]STY43982.1 Uncharacterised protein [Listeria grayi]VEI35520.1 Uncharacterised protein [Listeria grayi]
MYVEIYVVGGESIRLDEDAKINGVPIQQLTKQALKESFNDKAVELTKFDLSYVVNTALITWYLIGDGIH